MAFPHYSRVAKASLQQVRPSSMLQLLHFRCKNIHELPLEEVEDYATPPATEGQLRRHTAQLIDTEALAVSRMRSTNFTRQNQPHPTVGSHPTPTPETHPHRRPSRPREISTSPPLRPNHGPPRLQKILLARKPPPKHSASVARNTESVSPTSRSPKWPSKRPTSSTSRGPSPPPRPA